LLLSFFVKGNNGGDGIVAALHLVEHGYDVYLLYVSLHLQLGRESLVFSGILQRELVLAAPFS